MTQPKITPIFSSPREINKNADQALVDSLHTTFPIENKHYILSVDNIKVYPTAFTTKDEKDAILRSKSLTYPIKGDLTLTSKATGKIVDKVEQAKLLDSYYLTNKHTLLYKGNNYTISNQLQLLPGVYVRTRENTGELESHFNTGKGASFRIVLDPKLKVFFLEAGSSHTPLSPILSHVFGVSAMEAEKYVPKDVWEANIQYSAGNEDKILKRLYSRLVYSKEANPSMETMATELRESLGRSTLDAETTKITLGQSFTSITKECLLATIKKLVQVHTGEVPEDNRDSLQFKRVQNLPDFLRTRFAKDHETVRRVKNKLQFGLEKIDPHNPRIADAVPLNPFNKVYSAYISQSSLISTPSETNPLESLENVGKVTVLGPAEGGISEERGVPLSARNIDPSHLGILDPARTPESGHAGIDQRFTITAARDPSGKLYAKVLDLKGNVKHLSVVEMMDSVIGFADQKGNPDVVEAQDHGEMRRVPRSKVQYWIYDPTSLYTVTTNLVPFLNSNHPGRLTMAGKALPQALSLVNRDVPLVQTLGPKGKPFIKDMGMITSTNSQVNGTVIEANSKRVVIKDDKGEKHVVEAVKNLPFNMKGFQDDEKLAVKVGDKVTPGQHLYENNYTVNGNLALGKTLNVAYLPYKGYNHEDGIVMSQSAAASLTSHHAYKVDYEVNADTVAKKSLIKRYFPGKYTNEQLSKLDDQGYAKVDEVLEFGDPVYAVLEKREPTPEDRLLGRLHKSLVNPYRLVSEEWHHEEKGTVVDSHTGSKDVRILLRSQKPLEIGDKLTGLHGNKGIVSLIMPDNEMPFNKETGKPVDMLLNPASVTSRINLGQIMETAAGRIAQATGKPYYVKNFETGNNVKRLQEELKANGLKDTDELIDPKTGKSYGEIFGGPQYMLKLYKTTTENLSARNVGGYDNVGQPTKGGEEGSKSVGWMEMLGLLGSDARHNLKEISTVKSENSPEYWTKFIRGEALPKPKTTFATQKFFDMLRASGVNVKIENEHITAAPMTDKEILAQSNGELKEPSMLSAKNLEPEDGGLFDQVITGGLKGNKWSHYQLAEPVVNPIFENPVKSILGLSTVEYDNITSGKYGVKDLGGGNFEIWNNMDKKKIRDLKVNK